MKENIQYIELAAVTERGIKRGHVWMVTESGKRIPFIGKRTDYQYQKDAGVGIATKHNTPFLEVDLDLIQEIIIERKRRSKHE